VQLIACIGGLPREAVEEIGRRSPAMFTGDKTNLPIVRAIKPPYEYRQGMSDYYLGEIANRLTAMNPLAEVGIALAYTQYGAGDQQFVRSFYPHAAVAHFPPFYPEAHEKRHRREELEKFIKTIQSVLRRLHERIAIVRDVFSADRFSPLLLPLRNFESDVLNPSITAVFNAVATAEDLRAVIEEHRTAILAKHPLRRIQPSGHHRATKPYFEDDRSLRFKSPGSDRHGMARLVTEAHQNACLINSRARFGGPLDALFHYDCDYEDAAVDSHYVNCHGVNTQPARRTHVNIAPSDAIR
jgi:hypothetical protein